MGRAFHGLCLLSVCIALGMLAVLLIYLLQQGVTGIDWSFLTSFPSRHPDKAGIKPAMLGSIYVVLVAGVVSFTLGVATALFLEEYATRSKFAKIAKINIANLAGVPSIVYGILGLQIFVHSMHLGNSVLAGGFTLALLVLPIVIVAASEAVRAVPPSLREGSYALGATRWQVIWRMVIPQAFPGILTGVILAVSRAIGETAPLIAMGALTFVPFTPDSPLSRFTVLPIQIFNWTSRPQEGFRETAAAGIIVLLVILLVMNAGAVILRNRFQNKWE
ncbi:MAG: phosphate ABC transporter permease PstA [SAR202 cluster bacterium]|nr:phosphate ABC transporter permease PstA [SAR202 cluster bacterium]MQG15007.1 phosphate ABC transporter permease PstA [SAR202 cluster bacterium]MQG32194.1 phosphate ABC transporter permease PstA [SAR202 cluster bacterium]MQG40790.1 phosphate ABC transporter permease PstA [SAR202 cluster bacterium]MQG45215.1 phosphate ABC transporter permease PstA [SAR202 cluster bacterium]